MASHQRRIAHHSGLLWGTANCVCIRGRCNAGEPVGTIECNAVTTRLGESRSVLTPSEWQTIANALCLSKRGSEVAHLLLDGLNEDEISDALKLSRRTVHAHLERLYRRLGVHSRADLILCLFREFVRLMRCIGEEV